MTHFDIEQWADFSRGAATGADRALMQRHLASGCGRCNRMVDLLVGVAAVTRADKDYDPPAAVVRRAKALYRPQRPERLTARVIYDSFRDPLPAGVRTQDRLTRHVLYQAGDYSLDVRVEQHAGAATATLVGQVVTRERPGTSAGDVQVMLRRGTKTVAAASGNAFGEFQLDYRPVASLQLEVTLGTTGPVLELPLDHAVEPDEPDPQSPKRSR
jgi:hypothetical protein